MTELLANLATTTLAGNLSSGGLSATVVSDAIFPATGNFRIRIGSEIIIVTDTSGTNVFGGLTRGAEGTTAASHVIGDEVRQVLTRDGLAQIILDGAGASDPELAILAAMDNTHATTYRDATAWGLALLLDANATESKTALGLELVNNTPDSAKIVSSLQAIADATVTRNAINLATYSVLPADIGKCVEMAFSGAQTVTLRTATSAGIAAGQWFDLINTNATGVKTFAWEAGVTVRDPVTGSAIAGASSTTLAPYERLRFSFIGTNIWSMGGRTPAYTPAASPDIALIKEAWLNIEDPSIAPATGAAKAGVGQGATNRAAIQGILDVAQGTAGAEVMIPPGKVFEIPNPGGLNPIGIQVKDQTTLRLMGDLVPTGATWSGGALVKFASVAGGQINDCSMIGLGSLGSTTVQVSNLVHIDILRHGDFRQFQLVTPNNAGIKVTNSSTAAIGTSVDSDGLLFDQIRMRGSNAAWTPNRFIVIDGTNANGHIVSDMTVTNCKCQGGMQPQTTPGTLTTGGWGFEVVNASRIEFNGGNFCCHHNATNNACYSGGWLFRSSGGQDCNDCVVLNPYVEATTSPVNSAWEFNTIRLEITGGAGGIDGTLVRGLHQSVSAPVALNRRLSMERLSGTGTMTHLKWRDPRTTASNAAAYFLGAGANNNYIETMTGSPGGEAWTNAGTGNIKVGLVVA